MAEEKNYLFCSECGKKIKASAHYCTHCGHPVEDLQPVEPEQTLPIGPEVVRVIPPEEVADTAYKILEPGASFKGYTIVRLLNKEPEGIKYVATKDDKQYVLKLFFKSKFSAIETIISLQNRLKQLNKLQSVHTARVVEVNQNHDPAYMVTEYVGGVSLDRLKNSSPDRITEDLVRKVALQLIEASTSLIPHGLSLSELTLSGIMIDDDDHITVLSSGIRYLQVDEREEIFNIAVLLSQLLSRNALYKTIYNNERLQGQKFSYIPGATVSLNKVLAECLHRNILQRYDSLASLRRKLQELIPVAKDEIYQLRGTGPSLKDLQDAEAPKPVTHIEWGFFAIVGGIVLGLVLFVIFALPKIFKVETAGEVFETIFNADQDEPKQEAEAQPQETFRSTPEGGTRAVAPPPDYPRTNPGTTTPPANRNTAPPRAPIPANFVHISSGSLGFNRLRENPNDNVSLDGFYISAYETTQKEWSAHMMPATVSYYGENLPVDNISWMQAILYCNARSEREGLTPAYTIGGSSASSITCNFKADGYRLPTEAEWEMAAKAGALTDYSGSDDPGEVAWHRDNSSGRYRNVGGKNPNGYGIYDMSGNVAEWVWDWYDSKYPANLSTFINPTGPETGLLKVIRGGSVRNGIGTNLGILYRDRGDPGKAYQYVGFRLVRKF